MTDNELDTWTHKCIRCGWPYDSRLDAGKKAIKSPKCCSNPEIVLLSPTEVRLTKLETSVRRIEAFLTKRFAKG